jgi:hypothetical protein
MPMVQVSASLTARSFFPLVSNLLRLIADEVHLFSMGKVEVSALSKATV